MMHEILLIQLVDELENEFSRDPNQKLGEFIVKLRSRPGYRAMVAEMIFNKEMAKKNQGTV